MRIDLACDGLNVMGYFQPDNGRNEHAFLQPTAFASFACPGILTSMYYEQLFIYRRLKPSILGPSLRTQTVETRAVGLQLD